MSLDPSGAFTLSTWLRPEKRGTQYVVRKGRYGRDDGFELSLSSSGAIFARFDQASAGNAFRLDSTSDYPTDGTRWVHVAVTFDGAQIALFVDCALDVTQSAPDLSISANPRPLSIGAQEDGTRAFQGSLDELILFDRALSASEIAALGT